MKFKLEEKKKTYRKFHHERVDDTANYSDEVKGVPRIFEIALNVNLKVNVSKAVLKIGYLMFPVLGHCRDEHQPNQTSTKDNDKKRVIVWTWMDSIA